MTGREGAILSAHTGILLCNIDDYHKYVSELMGRPVWTHELGGLMDEVKKRSTPDFLELVEDQKRGDNKP
ncbi:MAG: hypothetical protein PHV18_04385 [Lachnospiraceae bacterium]|nr:hypothetical protein [Lachnospiraceae bacterium]